MIARLSWIISILQRIVNTSTPRFRLSLNPTHTDSSVDRFQDNDDTRTPQRWWTLVVTKVRRVIDQYELSGLGDELAARWVGDGHERESLRSLADRFNRQLLAANMDAAGLSPLDGEVDNTYRLLTDEEVSAGMETQARRRLEREGIDLDQLGSDFVSHQAVHTYLTKDREIEPPDDTPSTAERLERDRETIQRLESRLEAVTDNTVSRLDAAETLSIGEFSVLVDVQVFCDDCGQQYEISNLLAEGGCQCRPQTVD